MLIMLLPLVVSTIAGGQTDARTELHISFITSFGGEFDSSESIPAVKLATDIINKDENILPGHKLVVDLLDSPAVARKFTDSNVSS